MRKDDRERGTRAEKRDREGKDQRKGPLSTSVSKEQRDLRNRQRRDVRTKERGKTERDQ